MSPPSSSLPLRQTLPNPKLFFPHSLEVPLRNKTILCQVISHYFFLQLNFSLFFIFPESFFVCAVWTPENWSHSCHKQNYNFCSRTWERWKAGSWGGEGNSEAAGARESQLSTHWLWGFVNLFKWFYLFIGEWIPSSVAKVLLSISCRSVWKHSFFV